MEVIAQASKRISVASSISGWGVKAALRAGCTVAERRDFTIPTNSVVCSTGRSASVTTSTGMAGGPPPGGRLPAAGCRDDDDDEEGREPSEVRRRPRQETHGRVVIHGLAVPHLD